MGAETPSTTKNLDAVQLKLLVFLCVYFTLPDFCQHIPKIIIGNIISAISKSLFYTDFLFFLVIRIVAWTRQNSRVFGSVPGTFSDVTTNFNIMVLVVFRTGVE